MNDNAKIVVEKIVTGFEESLVADCKAHKTIESYVGDIRAFLEWLEPKCNTFTGNLKKISHCFV